MERTTFLPHFSTMRSGIWGTFGGAGDGGTSREGAGGGSGGRGHDGFMGVGTVIRRALLSAGADGDDGGAEIDDNFMPCGADDDYEYIQTDILYEDPCPARYTCVKLKDREAESKYNS